MKDSISARVTRIVSGSLHALLDAVEQTAPEAAMAQAIREVDQVIDEVRAELGRVIANRHLADANLARLSQRHQELSAHIEIAVGKGEDELSRAGIARQLDIEAQRPVVEKAIAESGENEKELEGYLLALQARKREMEDALNEFIASRATVAKPGTPAVDPSNQRVERAQAAFGRIMARETGLSGAGGADAAADAAKLRELAELARVHAIEERLASLKAKGGR